MQNPLFDVNNEYLKYPLVKPYSRPLIQAIKNQNPYAISQILKHPNCNIHLEDSHGKTAMDYIIAMPENTHTTREYKNVFFGYLVDYNKKQEMKSIFKNKNLGKRLNWQMSYTLFNKDNSLYDKLIKTKGGGRGTRKRRQKTSRKCQTGLYQAVANAACTRSFRHKHKKTRQKKENDNRHRSTHRRKHK
jgi:hypothetical protein